MEHETPQMTDTAIKQCQAQYTKMRYTPTVGEQTVLNRTLERSVKIIDKGYYIVSSIPKATKG